MAERFLGHLFSKTEAMLNNISLKWKLILMYLFCVILPLIISDGAVIFSVLNADLKARHQEMDNVAEAIKYSMSAAVESAVDLTQVVYGNRYVNEFLEGSYDTPLDYYNAYVALMKDSLYETGMGAKSSRTVIYADNPGFVNGGYFARLETIEDTEWYRELLESEKDIILFPHFGKSPYESQAQKKMSIIRWMDYYHKGMKRNVLRMDLDYSALSRSIINARYSFTVYVCNEDKILFSNGGTEGVGKGFDHPRQSLYEKAGVRKKMELYGQQWTILVVDNRIKALDIVKSNLPLFAMLLLVNILVPALFMGGVNRSFTRRLRELGDVFERGDEASIPAIASPAGKDEIGVLMRRYNHMADRINELIRTVYKDRLKEQEIDIARQQAELLALHSQINPHFLFNALESIRMHSLIKKEYETADMVEKLAVMQRQNVEWGNDSVRLSEELNFVEAYLELQKYRFGKRLSYRIEVEEGCSGVRIPKLTLVTFVENACVHGMEKKPAAGWIFVRCRQKQGQLILEVEDTGQGMNPEQIVKMQEKMNDVRIEQLKEKGRVGVLNACLRLKMATGGNVRFELESEEGAGLLVTIRMPFDVIREGEDVKGNAGG